MRAFLFSFLLAAGMLLFALPTPTQAQSLDAQRNSILNPLIEVGSPGYGDQQNPSAPRDLRLAILNIVRMALALVGTVVLVLGLYAGFLWFTAEGNADQVEEAKSTLRNLVIGWFVIALAYSFVTFVFRSIYVQQPANTGTQTLQEAASSGSFWREQLLPF